MSLSIRNGEVERLARQLAEREQRAMTDVILSALEDRVAAAAGQRAERARRLLEIGRRCSAAPNLDGRSFDEIVGYDANGAF